LPARLIGLEFWSMSTLPLSEAKARLSQIADEVHRTHERVTITKNGRSYLVLMSAEDLESIEATLELLADGEALRRVGQARQDLDAGRGTSREQMAELMAARRERGA
jgi:antitoxin YefM